jgi:hypothetical protein
MATRIFLGINAIIWLPYGLYLVFQPGFLEGAAGVAATTVTGQIELRAMYGGLQAAIGALCARALLDERYARPALVMLAFAAGGLFLARLTGTVVAGDVSTYTGTALGLESTLTVVSTWLLIKRESAAARADA